MDASCGQKLGHEIGRYATARHDADTAIRLMRQSLQHLHSKRYVLCAAGGQDAGNAEIDRGLERFDWIAHHIKSAVEADVQAGCGFNQPLYNLPVEASVFGRRTDDDAG